MLEKHALKNDVSAIIRLSGDVKEALEKIKVHLLSNGGKVIFCEGDSLLIESEKQISLSNDILIHGEFSFSAGIGRSTAMALLALKKS